MTPGLQQANYRYHKMVGYFCKKLGPGVRQLFCLLTLVRGKKRVQVQPTYFEEATLPH